MRQYVWFNCNYYLTFFAQVDSRFEIEGPILVLSKSFVTA